MGSILSYGSGYSYSSSDGAAAAILVIVYIVAIALCIFELFCLFRIYREAGEPGWAAFVPFYNCFVFFRIATGSGANMFRLLIPFYGVVYEIIATIKFAIAMGYSGGFGVGLVFLPFIFLPIMAFGRGGSGSSGRSQTPPPVNQNFWQ